ncbi:DUF6516 family protein [Chloroflexota bacterium]
MICPTTLGQSPITKRSYTGCRAPFRAFRRLPLSLSTPGRRPLLSRGIHLGESLVLRVVEVVDTRQRRIEHYGYELWRGNVELTWFDSWPPPDAPELASTHPHHQHLPPDIKRHRVPAPGLGFDTPIRSS